MRIKYKDVGLIRLPDGSKPFFIVPKMCLSKKDMDYLKMQMSEPGIIKLHIPEKLK